MKRKHFLQSLAAVPLLYGSMKLTQLNQLTEDFSASKKTPLLFIGHGHPMNALLDNSFTQRLGKLGKDIEKPNAVMVVSAHWETRGTYVSVNSTPKTIYDFGRFDDRLFQIKYEPKGHPDLAQEVINTAPEYNIQPDDKMGLDHGAWTILKFIFPEQDIPVFQLSVDYTQPASYHFQLAAALKKLREKGVLIIGSGNIVHNLRRMDWHNINAQPYDWTIEFDETVKNKLNTGNFSELVDYKKLGTSAMMSIPTPDHYLPMIYTIGLADKNEPISYLYEGYQYAGISMRCFQVG